VFDLVVALSSDPAAGVDHHPGDLNLWIGLKAIPDYICHAGDLELK